MPWKSNPDKSLPITESDSWGPEKKKALFDWASDSDGKIDSSKAKRVFLAYNTDDEDIQEGYKLPFASIVNGSPRADIAGLNAASKRLPNTDIPNELKVGIQKTIDNYRDKRKSRVMDVLEMVKSMIIEDDRQRMNNNIWKDSDGVWRFIGVFSNKFVDTDFPPDIISEKAHKDFIKRASSGQVSLPWLTIHHAMIPIGQVEKLLWHTDGFAVCYGRFLKPFGFLADALSRTHIPLGMSHAARGETVEREDEDPRVITRYTSYEVSIVSLEKAANPLTSFGVVRNNMEQMIEKQKEILKDFGPEGNKFVEDVLGTDGLARVNDIVARMKMLASEIDLQFKERNISTEETNMSEVNGDNTQVAEAAVAQVESAETTNEAEAVAGATAEAKKEVDAGSSDVTNAQDGTDTGEANESDKPADAYVESRVVSELAEAMATQFKSLSASLEKSINERIETEISKLKFENEALKNETEVLINKSKSTYSPIASVFAAAIEKSMSGGATAEGKPETRVHGNSSLAKDKPREASGDTGYTNQTAVFSRVFSNILGEGNAN